MKKLLLCMLLASGVVLLHAQAQAAEKKSPEAQLTAAQAVPAADVASDTTVAKPAIKIFRDQDWNQGGYGKDVKIQSAAYKAARDKYKSTWDAKDVQACSDLAFTTPTAAWPWANLSWHLIDKKGDLGLAKEAAVKASQIIGDFVGEDADQIRTYIEQDLDVIESRQK